MPNQLRQRAYWQWTHSLLHVRGGDRDPDRVPCLSAQSRRTAEAEGRGGGGTGLLASSFTGSGGKKELDGPRVADLNNEG